MDSSYFWHVNKRLSQYMLALLRLHLYCCILFKTDFNSLETACQKKPLHRSYLTLEKVAISNCLFVSGFSDGTSESTLKSYFENEKRSGGGTVTCIKVNHSDCYKSCVL